MRTKLFWQLALAYLLLLAVALVVVDHFLAATFHEAGVEAGFHHIEGIGRLLEARAIQPHDPAAMESWTRWASGMNARVTVFDSSGIFLADAAGDPRAVDGDGDLEVVKEAFTTGRSESVRRSIGGDREIVYRALRYTPPEGPAHVVRVAVFLQSPMGALWGMRLRLLTAFFLVALVTGAATLVAARRFERRAKQLAEFCGRMAEGDYRPLPAPGAAEELAKALSAAAAKLEGTIRALTGQRNFSDAVLGSMTEGVAVVSAEGRVVFANQAFADAVGEQASEWKDRPLVEVFRHPDLVEAVQRALAGSELVRSEVEFGTVRPRSFGVTAAPVAAATARGAVLVLHDVSEIRRLERVRRDFVANVSHQLRTPLTAIQGFAETLLGGALDDPAANRRFLEIIREHATRLGRLTDDLLKLSAIEAGKLTFAMRPVSVARLFEACAETARLKAGLKKIELHTEGASEVTAVLGDEQRLQEVLQNLLDNAIQYTPAGGRVSLRARKEDKQVVLSVEDTGMGIPQNEQERIFERFYRLEAARSVEAGGTGLGLSIVRHIVEAHNGRIWVESEVGRGSQFYVSIPIAEA